MSVESMNDKAERLVAARDAQITPEYRYSSASVPLNVSQLHRTSGFLSPDQVEIISHDATSLAEAIARRHFTAVEVTEAFCRAAALAQQTTNCLAWFEPVGALERARWLDAELKRTGRVIGPLHGVPISVKGTSPWKSR
jgi:amidase